MLSIAYRIQESLYLQIFPGKACLQVAALVAATGVAVDSSKPYAELW